MATNDKLEAEVSEAAKPLKGTPYELTYISKPTASTVKFAFQHTVATSPQEAMMVITVATAKLADGTAEWSSGEPYVTEVAS